MTALSPRTRRLLYGPVLPTLLRLAAPNLVLTLVQSAVALVEMYWLARLGTDVLAGTALVYPALSLMQMLSGGAFGGAMSSAVARALGAGRRDLALELAYHALAVAIAIGGMFSVLFLVFGPVLYRAMGGSGASLAAALTYSNVVFSAIVLMWVFNAQASVLRGAGNVAYPAAVIAIGGLLVAAASPLLIFGYGPFPRLGVAGGGLAVALYYGIGAAVLAARLASGREAVTMTWRWPRFAGRHFASLLTVGLASGVIAITTNLTVGLTSSLIGRAGPAAVAGYGTGARLEYLITSISFGLGIPVVAMVGTAIGAGENRRARRIAWTGAAIGGGIAALIGLAAALWPLAWLGLFSQDPQVLRAGTPYLERVGPAYGLFGMGMLLYFASQGTGRMRGPAAAGLSRLAVAGGGGWAAFWWSGGDPGATFLALAASLAVFGVVNAAALRAWPS